MRKKIIIILITVGLMTTLIACGKQEDALSQSKPVSINRLKVQKVFNSTTKSKLVHEAVLIVENSDGSVSENFEYGGRDIDTPMLCASVTKLFTTSCILKLCEEGKLSLDDKVTKYFDEDELKGLHVYKGHDYTNDLTLAHLLFQTSGLPDETEDGNADYLLDGDYYVTFEQELESTKKQTPIFAPGTGKKANYANINFDLLGRIMEKVTDKPLAEIYNEMVFTPLGLDNTYLVTDEKDLIPYTYYKDQKIERPQIVASSGAAGGCVSTPRDLMKFIKGFWQGKLFDKEVFQDLAIYKKLQSNKGPIHYGGGYMEIPLDGYLTMFMGKGELVGHTGSTGSFVFYYPEKDLYFAGDLTETSNPALPIRLAMKLAMTK